MIIDEVERIRLRVERYTKAQELYMKMFVRICLGAIYLVLIFMSYIPFMVDDGELEYAPLIVKITTSFVLNVILFQTYIYNFLFDDTIFMLTLSAITTVMFWSFTLFFLYKNFDTLKYYFYNFPEKWNIILTFTKKSLIFIPIFITFYYFYWTYCQYKAIHGPDHGWDVYAKNGWFPTVFVDGLILLIPLCFLCKKYVNPSKFYWMALGLGVVSSGILGHIQQTPIWCESVPVNVDVPDCK